MPSRFWCEALSTMVHLINRLPSPSLHNDSPFTRLFGDPLDYSTLRTFGCVCYVHLPSHEGHKLTAQYVECVFPCYSSQQKGFLCYDLHLDRIHISKNVILLENKYHFATHHDSPRSPIFVLPMFSNSFAEKPLLVYQRRCKTTHHQSTPSLGPPQNHSWVADPLPTDPTPLRCSTHVHKPPEKYSLSLTATLSSVSIPSSYKQAMEHECWQRTIEAELLALEKNQTWDVVPCPPSVKPLGSKFVFSIKLRFDGSIDRHKAQLVVLGNKQEYGLDDDETFAPVAKMTNVRTIVALVVSQS